MATKRWIGWAAALAGAVAGALVLADAAGAASRRDAGTQVRNNLGRIAMPIQRQLERLAERDLLAAGWAGSLQDRVGDESGSSSASGSAGAKRTGEPFEWSKAIAAGKAIEVKGVNGDITASRAAGKDVEVRATKRARKSDPDEVTIEVIEHGGGVTICAKYPDVNGKRNTCGPGDQGHMNTNDNDVQVDFEVRVPAGVQLIARTVNGEIEAEDLASPVDAATVNGSVRVSTSGTASAATVNGSIAATLGEGAWTEPLSFNTVNGAIRLTLPTGLDADVRAETLNGVIHSDFPVTVRGKINKRRLQGSIGKGGHRLDLETVNGNISLRQSSS